MLVFCLLIAAIDERARLLFALRNRVLLPALPDFRIDGAIAVCRVVRLLPRLLRALRDGGIRMIAESTRVTEDDQDAIVVRRTRVAEAIVFYGCRFRRGSRSRSRARHGWCACDGGLGRAARGW